MSGLPGANHGAAAEHLVGHPAELVIQLHRSTQRVVELLRLLGGVLEVGDLRRGVSDEAEMRIWD